jgi:hypothetical protein
MVVFLRKILAQTELTPQKRTPEALGETLMEKFKE